MTLLSACLIVKNEERFLPGCLASLVGLADELVIVDTGSTDRTVAIAREYGAVVLEHGWKNDFSEARNFGLARASGQFILYLDADEEVFPEDRAPLRATLASDRYDALLVRIVSPLFGGDKTAIDVYPRVFRNYPDARFRYRIHEQIWPSLAPHGPRVQDSSFRILHHGYAQSPDVLDRKRTRNLETALEVLAENPDDGFYLYHAGFACLTLGRLDEARRWLARALRHTAPGRARVPALNALAQTHVDAKEPDLALPLLAESTGICAEQFHGWGLLADIHLQRQRHDLAVPVLEQLLAVVRSAIPADVTPARPALELKLGLSLLLLRRPDLAAVHLEAALAGELTDDQRDTGARYLTLAQRMRAADAESP